MSQSMDLKHLVMLYEREIRYEKPSCKAYIKILSIPVGIDTVKTLSFDTYCK